MNRLSRVYTSLSLVLILLAIVCAPLVARATTVATPVLSLATGTYTGTQTVTITDSTSGSKIYYTLGVTGTTPTTSSTLYSGPITVSSSQTLEAMATATGDTQSATATAAYTILGTLQVYLSGPGVQSTSVAGAATETFDALTPGVHTTAYVSTAGIGTYTGSSSQPFAIEAPGEFGGATDSTHTSSTNYFAVGGDSASTSPVYLTLTNPVSYFGFWWSAGDSFNRVALYSGSTLFGTFSTANLLTFLNNGSGTITATNGTVYQTSAYFGNPNITSGANDSTEPFAYVSFVVTGATITQIAFYNTEASGTSFESDNHSAIFTGNTVTIPTTFVPVETLSLGSQAVQPVFSPVAGTYATPQTVTISSSTPGASINYTTNGTAPTATTGTVCGNPCSVSVAVTETLEAIAYETGMTSSTVTSAVYTIPLSVAVSPASATVSAGGTQQFTATVVGSTNTAVTWSISPATGAGTISTSSGLYTAPASVTTPQTVTITATSQANTSVKATATLTLKATPTLTFTTIPAKTYGVAPFTVSASSASKSGAITYSVTSGPATISGSTVTVTGVGPVVLGASQAATTTYTAATASTSFTVSAAPLTITASGATVTYGAAVPTITPSFSGFVNGQTSTSLTTQPTCTTAYTTTSAAGSSPSTSCSGAVDANYSISYVFGTVTVNKASPTVSTWPTASGITYGQTLASSTLSGGTPPVAGTFAWTTPSTAPGVGTALQSVTFTPTSTNYTTVVGSVNVTVSAAPLTITASSATVTYGAAVPTITPSFSGFVNGQTSVSLTTQPTCTTAYAPTSAAGSSPSTSCSGAVDANYSISYVSGAVTVNKAPLTITASSATVTYGAAVPTITPSFSGFVNGQTSASLTTQPTCTTAYTTTSAAGSLPSTSCSGAVDANYSISYVSGMVTVNKAPLTITASSTTVTYGAAVPTITPSFSGFVNGQTSTSLTTQPTCTTAYTTTSAAGSSPSTSCSGAVDANYSISYVSGTVTVNEASPTVSAWPTASAITYGQTLASSTLSGGTASVGGTFAWTTPSTGPGVGTASESVTFTPTSTNYTTVVGSVSVTVGMATPTVSAWPTASAITYGQTLASSTLSGGTASVPGTFAWTTPSTTPGAGTTSESVTFTPTASTSYSTVAGSVSVTVSQAVTVTPSSVTLSQGQTQQFTATVNGVGSQAVNWTISSSGTDTINASGLYTAPASITTQQTVTVTATSQANSTTGTATVTLTPIWPISGPVGTVVTITGIGFGGAEGASSVTVGGLPAVTLSWSSTQIQAQIPTGTGLGNQAVVVTVGGQTVTNTTFDVTSGLTGITPPAAGTPASVTIDTPGQTAELIFNGVPEQIASVQLNDNFSYFSSTNVTIVNPDGSTLPTQGISNGPGTVNFGVLTQTGPYTLIISPWEQGTGSSSFTLYLFQNLTGTITSGTPVTATITIPEQEELLTFTGFIGEAASVQLNDSFSYHGYANVTIVNPDGSTLPTQGIGGGSGTLNFGILPQYGTYTLVIAPVNGGTGSSTALLTLTLPYSTVKMSASLVPSESSLGNPVAVNLTLTANNGAPPPGTVSCSGAGVISSQVSVSSNGTAVVPMNGLPLGNDAIICSYVSIDPASFSNAVSFPVIESVAAAPVTGAVSVNPAGITLYAGQAQQFSASVFNTSNQAVTWSMPVGSQGTLLTASGLYTAPGSIASPQTVAITATGQGSGASSGTAIVTLLPAPANPKLTLAATAQPPYVTGTSQTFVVTLTNQDGTPIPDESVTFTVIGANNNTGIGTTNANGIATYAYTGAKSGNDTIQTTASVSGVQATSDKLPAVWIVPSQPIATTSVLGQFFFYNPLTDADGEYVFNTPPTAVPAFTEEFPNICFNPPSETIPGNTTVGVGTHPFTDVTTDENGNFTGTIAAQGNGYQAGLNEPGNGTEGSIQNQGIFQGVFTGSYIVASAGDAVINVYVDNTFILGIGGGATSVSVNPPLGPGPTTTPFEQLPVMGNSGYNNTIGGYSMTVYFPGPGTYPYELDYVECCGLGGADTLSLMMSMGPIDSSGLPPAGALTIKPNSLNPLPAGSQQVFTVQAVDASGNPVPNLNVTLEISGVDSQELTATTNASGSASFTYKDVNPGTASVQAVALIDGMVTFSSQVSVPWTLPPSTSTTTGGSGTLAISIAADSSVSLPNTLQLVGTATDSGLPSGSSPAMTWTGSGPGTVTFAPNPNQASVAATFSLPGSYIVKLSASDSVPNSGSVQWPVTVNPPQQNMQGWIGSPTYGSAVSGVVPITVASGVTLQSGTLTYYSASNPNSVITLNANTTGSGQIIGTLDTTTLVNGSYWIQLQALDTSGDTQYSLVLVTVSGNYKPGRVTATVTDLVVPATGLAINIQRNYDSLNSATSSDFGYGWSLGINVNLAVDPVGNVTFTLGGQRKTFYLAPQPQTSSFGGETFEFWPWYLPAYTPEPGLHGTLTDGGSGCIAVDFLTPNGNLWSCAGAGLYNPTIYIYTDPSGTAYTISAAGNLQSIKDLSGNGLTITANGITSTTGLSVPFVRDSSNRITQITDPAGNIYQYGYDANGNLATVTYPVSAQSISASTCTSVPASGISTYTYDPTFIHLYTGGTDGRGCQLPTSTYYNSATDDGNSTLDGRLMSSTDPFNNTTSYAYNLSTTSTINGVSVPNTGVTTITYPDKNTATMVYDSYGDLLQSTDPNNLTTVNAYDANHNLVLVTDPLRHANSYTYDSNGNKTSSTYPATATSTNTTSYTYYNQYSEPTSTIDELGNVRLFNYDTNFLPQSVTDNLGTLASFVFNANSTLASGAIGFDISVSPAQASQFTYDAYGNMASRTDALGRTTSYVYNSLGQKTSMTAPTPTSPTGSAASTTSYVYDAMGNLTSTTAPLGRITSSTYDANGNKLSDTDARGKTTNYIYDALNRLVETDYPDQTSATKTYDFRNNVLKETDQAKNVTLHVYDAAGRQTSVTRGYGSTTTAPSTTSYTYYDDGRKYKETDPANNVTTYVYDAAGRLTSVTGAQGATTYTYDDAGNRISQADGKGNTTGFQYDARKRLIETDYPATANYPDGTSVKNTYDGPGNLASVTDQAQNVVQYTYDAANQLKTVVQVNSPNAPANTNSYGYDPLGNLTSLEDERSDTTQNLFDQYGEPTQKTLPASQIETRTYDGAGNLATLTHFNQVTTTYTYDALNRLLSRSTPGEPSDTVSFTYTATGKYLTSTAQDGTVNYTYDALDRLKTKATPEGTLSYTYFPTGKVETIASSNPHGVSTAYTWDDQNRLSTVVDGNLSGQNTTTYSYDAASNLVTAAYPNNLTSTYTYDALNRLTELATPPVADYKYTLGATGIRTNATELNEATQAPGRTLQWSYDNIYRLTGETIAGDPANNGDNNGNATYGLDPVGNRTSETSSLSGINPIAGAYNANDEMTSSETYDANGNTTQAANGNSYTYDSENHMIKMTNGSAVVTMIYDAFGNRVAKTVNGVTTQYLVEDDVNPTGYPQVVEELTGPIGSGVVTRQYTYGLQRISENQVIQGAWAPSFYQHDGAGSVRLLSNAAGTVTDTYEYDAFGNQIYRSGTTANNYMYRGEQYDQDLGLYYLRARYYNTGTGRLMSRDPEDGEAGDPKTLHKYLYVGGDPINWLDPTGREALAEYRPLCCAAPPPFPKFAGKKFAMIVTPLSPAFGHHLCLQFCSIALNACVLTTELSHAWDSALGSLDGFSGGVVQGGTMPITVNGRSLEDAQYDECAAKFIVCRSNFCGDDSMVLP